MERPVFVGKGEQRELVIQMCPRAYQMGSAASSRDDNSMGL
jgi:hypothetical protein